jgi:hypothetical protein
VLLLITVLVGNKGVAHFLLEKIVEVSHSLSPLESPPMVVRICAYWPMH